MAKAIKEVGKNENSKVFVSFLEPIKKQQHKTTLFTVENQLRSQVLSKIKHVQ